MGGSPVDLVVGSTECSLRKKAAGQCHRHLQFVGLLLCGDLRLFCRLSLLRNFLIIQTQVLVASARYQSCLEL
jgi:hypothetical protein